MKIKTSDLIGDALDWAVAIALGKRPSLFIFQRAGKLAEEHNYSTDWAQGGSIISREIIEHGLLISSRLAKCEAVYPTLSPQWVTYYGSTPLIAAMRCYVANKLGNEVEVPDELGKEATQRTSNRIGKAGGIVDRGIPHLPH